MNTDRAVFLDRLNGLLSEWEKKKPPLWTLLKELDDLARQRKEFIIDPLVQNDVFMCTGTLDDGWGHGLQVIHKALDVLGVRYRFLGLLLDWRDVIDACQSFRPNLLGLTVLHESSEDELRRVVENIPGGITVMVGGNPCWAELSLWPQVIYMQNVIKFFRFFLNL
ncbi:MAG TPA: hypothetical protein ENG14_04410 [Thermodesulforhabdus norvegica]|uniref:Uncharacterized protein n=1 Tax=Thermodesulforhabdus norvegica TaxID=39841 RepID=A0A7C0WVE3_9BACT|nr:hypothetical protein [Deltaproteobacteria bacterium]MBW2068404.1 hypothetical protein [Deltaproteobacteria bacterium]HDL90126.1 hypothetical protein [Thermodesulforhabdus norvegica]